MIVLELLKEKLHKDEGIDCARMTRFVKLGLWHVWTTEGRRVEINTIGADEKISRATVAKEADPEIPPVVR